MPLQILFNGISLGAVYALVAVGFCLVFSILKFTNFAHGAMISISAFIGYFAAIKFNLGLYGTLACAMLGGAIVGLVGEFLAFRNITKKSSSVFYYFVSSLTWGVFLEQLITLKVGSTFMSDPRFFDSLVIRFGKDDSLVVSTVDVYMLVFAVIALAILFFFLNKTKFGRAIRATSFDRDTAYLMGIDVYRCIQIVFILAGAMAGLGGVFLGITYTLTAQLGSKIVIKGFISSIIGGLGSIQGAVIGAFLLGITENVLIYFIGSGWSPVVTFSIMLAFLLIRPQGIAGVIVNEKA
ncbi:MAG: branched-chain amino acid ABC transporter permease [Oscillospiraceae bacterium]|nr:branched-chain amino acid ABC transporter permease [Oscillospiraceae bacterium]